MCECKREKVTPKRPPVINLLILTRFTCSGETKRQTRGRGENAYHKEERCQDMARALRTFNEIIVVTLKDLDYVFHLNLCFQLLSFYLFALSHV